MVRPGSPGWSDSVVRARSIAAEHPDWTDARLMRLLENCCQNVYLKYIPQLFAEAKGTSK